MSDAPEQTATVEATPVPEQNATVEATPVADEAAQKVATVAKPAPRLLPARPTPVALRSAPTTGTPTPPSQLTQQLSAAGLPPPMASLVNVLLTQFQSSVNVMQKSLATISTSLSGLPAAVGTLNDNIAEIVQKMPAAPANAPAQGGKRTTRRRKGKRGSRVKKSP